MSITDSNGPFSIDFTPVEQFAVSADRASFLAAGGAPATDGEAKVAATLRAGWLTGEWAAAGCPDDVCALPAGPATSVDVFELGVTLRAAATGSPQTLLVRPSFTAGALNAWLTDVIFVSCDASDREAVLFTVSERGGETVVVAEDNLLSLLRTMVQTDLSKALVVDAPSTLSRMYDLAKDADHADTDMAVVSAFIDWWVDRSEHPASGAALVVSRVLGSRYRIPVSSPGLADWAAWFGLSGGRHELLVALWAYAVHGVTGVPEAFAKAVAACDASSFGSAMWGVKNGRNWRRGDTVVEGAAGLASREASAELAAWLQSTDTAGFVRSRFAGVTVQGVAVGRDVDGRGHMVALDGFPCRLRDGNKVILTDPTGRVSAGDEPEVPASADAGKSEKRPKVSAEVKVSGYSSVDGQRMLIVESGPMNARWLDRLMAAGVVVQLMPDKPHALSHWKGVRSEVRSHCKPVSGDAASWLVAEGGAVPGRRDVPLDVLVAAAR